MGLFRRESRDPKLPLLPSEPVSRQFGSERGRPIDRWYIERFLKANAADVRGRVLEVAEPTYTQWYGEGDVTSSDVLYAAEGNPEATLVGDLVSGDGFAEQNWDCFICTQTLQFIADTKAAVAGTRRLLAPGGVLLATVPGISQISTVDDEAWGDWWRFNERGTRLLFEAEYGAENVTVERHGNVQAAAAFLYGMAAEDLGTAELEREDPDYHMVICVRAVRAD
jgi:SAM-dependent methyltransferase